MKQTVKEMKQSQDAKNKRLVDAFRQAQENRRTQTVRRDRLE